MTADAARPLPPDRLLLALLAAITAAGPVAMNIYLPVLPAVRTEFGVSVDPTVRGKGYGFALLERVVLHATNLGYRTLFVYCLAENGIMMHLARKAGLTLVVEAGEADARRARGWFWVPERLPQARHPRDRRGCRCRCRR